MVSKNACLMPEEGDKAEKGWDFSENNTKPICYKTIIQRSYTVIEEKCEKYHNITRTPNESMRDFITRLSKKFDDPSVFESYVLFYNYLLCRLIFTNLLDLVHIQYQKCSLNLF